ncbi:MAG: MBOAT family O-acyltransferase [Bdellovibrionota bacterium]
MLFNSYLFFVFFLAVVFLYSKLSHKNQNVLLLAASNVFYGTWDWRFLSLIWASTIVDFVVGRQLEKESSISKRRWLLMGSVLVNLGALALFKYSNFFISELATLLSSLGIPVSLPILNITLPVGISFYTFQTMSYTIDIYRRRVKATDDLLAFSLYVSFFPQLVAGPIERVDHILPQIQKPREKGFENIREGFYHVLIGLFKKVVIGDTLAGYVAYVFSPHASELSGGAYLMGVYAFAFQIYADFSGYSSIAQGTAKFLGFDLMFNFRFPYLTRNPSEFWKAWHISLSTWLRDYLYIPLGGNRDGRVRALRNLILTMAIGGLWHGAAWTFVAWGFFHGILLSIYRLVPTSSEPQKNISTVSLWGQRLLMFHLTCIGWLFFRATSLSQVWEILGRVIFDFDFDSMAATGAGLIIFFVGPLFFYELWLNRKEEPLALLNSHWLVRGQAYTYMVAMLICFPPFSSNEFIYFQF